MSNAPAFLWVADLLKAVFVLLVLLTLAPVMTLLERKLSAWSQDRVGPNRATFSLRGVPVLGAVLDPPLQLLGRAGLLQPMADAIKMITKEDFIPVHGDRLLHTLAPVIAMVPACITFAVIPFGPVVRVAGVDIPLQVANLNVGILFFFAVTSIAVYGTALAGWSSDNKFALMGGLRASAQLISYEISMGLSILGIIMVYGSVQLDQIVLGQQATWFGLIPKWGLFTQPLGFILFFTAVYAETKRAPFDAPEGESELVAGYFTEYSGLKFGMFYTAEFMGMVVLGGLITALFLGGYLIPFVPAQAALDGYAGLPAWFWALAMVAAFFLKVAVIIVLQFQIRWTLPRFRYDQTMRLGWKILLPAAMVNLFATGLVILW